MDILTDEMIEAARKGFFTGNGWGDILSPVATMAHNAAIEAAAKVASERFSGQQPKSASRVAGNEIAAAIRALKQ